MSLAETAAMRHVLLADDHEVTRRGVREILQDAFAGVEVSEATSGDEVLRRFGEHDWSVVILDVLMPGPPILELLVRIRELGPETPILVLTALTEVEYVVQTMRAGANGLIHKHRAADELVEAVEAVVGGGPWLHAETALAIAVTLRERKPTLPHHDLSPRELDVFRLIALGRPVKGVGLDLGLSAKTVATYLARIRSKTGLGSHVEIARYALKNGLVD